MLALKHRQHTEYRRPISAFSQVFDKLAQRMQQAKDQEQLGRSICLLLHSLRVMGKHSAFSQATVYPVLVEMLRRKEQHSCQVVQLVLEAVAVIMKQSITGCRELVDLGVVT